MRVASLPGPPAQMVAVLSSKGVRVQGCDLDGAMQIKDAVWQNEQWLYVNRRTNAA